MENNDSSFEDLPVQCLCEFLIHNLHDEDDRSLEQPSKQQVGGGLVFRECWKAGCGKGWFAGGRVEWLYNILILMFESSMTITFGKLTISAIQSHTRLQPHKPQIYSDAQPHMATHNHTQRHLKQEQLLERLQKLVRTTSNSPRIIDLTVQASAKIQLPSHPLKQQP